MPYAASLKKLSDVLAVVGQAYKTFGTDVWWRGHADATWHLQPSVHRKGNLSYEREVATRFFQSAPSRRIHCPRDDDFAAWLFLMQHHGLPTRLLDWTESALVALYFAVAAHDDKPSDLWALSPMILNRYQVDRGAIAVCSHKDVKPLVLPPLCEGVASPDKVMAVACREVDIRMLVQHACFTIHGSATCLEDVPAHDKFLLRFSIAPELKGPWKEALYRLGVRESTLFPDLDHLASELRELKFAQSEWEKPKEQAGG